MLQNCPMSIPETDVHRITRWCQARVPERAQHQVRVECDVADRHATIVEVRAPWDGVGDWTRNPIARLAYTTSSGLWTLHSRDRNQRFHVFTAVAPTISVQALLDYLNDKPNPIFWG